MLGRSDMYIDSVVLGGLGSGVGGLRWFTGVLIEGFFDIRDVTTPSACGGGLKVVAALSSWEFDGGVGGSPVSARFSRPGDARGVSCDIPSSSECNVCCFKGSTAGVYPCVSSVRRGRGLCDFSFGSS
jgi:hypothetical protein